MASRGRSTKIAEIMAQPRLELAGIGVARTGVPGRRLCSPSTMTRSPRGQAGFDDDAGSALLAELDAPDHGLAVVDDEDVDALLVGDQRGLRDHHLFHRRAAFEDHPHQLAVDQRALRIGDGGAQGHAVGAAIDGHVDEVDFADLVVQWSRRKTCSFTLMVVDIGLLVLAGLQHVGLAHRKGHIHRVLADDERQRPGVGADHIAFGDVGAADLSGDGRVDVGVAEIDVRGVQIGLVGQDLALGLLVGGERLVARHHGAGLPRHQLLGALELNLGERLCRLAALQGALGLLDGGLEESRLDLVERRAFLDRGRPP